VWESNPPERLLTPHTGFEDQRAHQNSSTPMLCDCKPEFPVSQYFETNKRMTPVPEDELHAGALPDFDLMNFFAGQNKLST